MRIERPRKNGLAPRLETLEERQVMSANLWTDMLGGNIARPAFDENPAGAALQHHVVDDGPTVEHHLQQPDFSIDWGQQPSLEDQLQQIDQLLAEAHAQTGWNTVQANFGFSGRGQTVAVIDSGIAYNHPSLGGGLGASYRVVGGWDFTEENDANPYDDGPSGSHGTHVAGIVGSNHTTHKGVATGVDLVGLRVFNDAGDGYFSWVENALDWVYANRNSFANPITAVNLSLGVSTWNSTSIPSWANLEDEFAQLEAAGIFIAVSAGNSFTSYNAPGLSYPAASPYVVPVMSTDDSGLLSYFSQRHTGAIAVPGRSIVSTVPDYNGNNNGMADDFGTKSGTSMASPYMAGASVLIRQAMQFAGVTNITQDAIYNVVTTTATSFFDSATNSTYKRLNLWAAIDSVMPDDDYGSTIATAYNLGTLNGGANLNHTGHIAAIGDQDYFLFTAAADGTVQFTASNLTHELVSSWTAYNSAGQSIATASQNQLQFSVAAGQTYTVSYKSSSGLGHYALNISAQSTFSYTDWGVVGFNQVNNQVVTGERWYRITTGQSGFLTVQASYQQAGGAIALGLYNSSLQPIVSANGANGAARVDTLAAAGTQIYVRVTGTNSDVDFQLTNLVGASGATITVAGTTGNDAFSLVAGPTHAVSINGVTYSLDGNVYNAFVFNGQGGSDSATLTGTTQQETANISPNTATLFGSGYTATVNAVASIQLHGGAGNYDIVNFFDSAGDDRFTANPQNGSLVAVNGSYSNLAFGFERMNASATAGGTNDRAYLNDSAGDDVFHARPTYGLLHGAGYEYYNFASGFDQVYAVATTGYDLSYQYDSAGNDVFHGRPEYSLMRGGNSEFYNHAAGFDRVYASGEGGGNDDVAYLYDSAANDWFTATPTTALLHSANYSYYTSVTNFEKVYASATAGGTDDRAYLYDSTGNDTFIGRPTYGLMQGPNSQFYNHASGFNQVYAHSTAGGSDIAYQYDSAGNDVFVGKENYALMRGENNEYYNYAESFEYAFAYAESGGVDAAYLYDSAHSDRFIAYPTYSVLRGANYQFYNYANGFDQVFAYATLGGAEDRAELYDSAGNDAFHGRPSYGLLHGANNEFYNMATGFPEVYAYATAGGYDIAYQYGSTGDDYYYGRPDYGLMRGVNNEFYNYTSNFERVLADASNGGNDFAFLYDSAENDYFYAYDSHSILQSASNSFYHRAASFDRVLAYSVAGGADDRAYYYGALGNDVFEARSNVGIMRGASYNYFNYAEGFDRYIADAAGAGNDSAIFEGAVSGNLFTGSGNLASMAWSAALAALTNFDAVEIHAATGQSPSLSLALVDYTFAQFGNWI